MVRIIIIIYSIFIPFNLARAELSEQEKIYFNFFDFNKDEHVSFEEINSTISIFFNLLDKNKDKKISEEEIIDLKSLIESF